jgi:hypothetical protein
VLLFEAHDMCSPISPRVSFVRLLPNDLTTKISTASRNTTCLHRNRISGVLQMNPNSSVWKGGLPITLFTGR